MTDYSDHSKQSTGKLGEWIATLYLIFHGYRILKRNYRFGQDEIDIIACSYRKLLFVEVKTRRYSKEKWKFSPPPSEAVDERKQEAVKRCARRFLRDYRIPGEKILSEQDWRNQPNLLPFEYSNTRKQISFDIAEIVLDYKKFFPSMLNFRYIHQAF